MLEHGCVYVVKLQETLDLPPSISAVANPKSSTGRIDVFTRLISDNSEAFDWVEAKYSGELFAEIFPRTFSIKVRTGTRLNQLRFLRRSGSQDRYWRPELSRRRAAQARQEGAARRRRGGRAAIRNGLNRRRRPEGRGQQGLVGYRARKFADVLDVERRDHDKRDFWEPIHASKDGRLILHPERVLHSGLAGAAAGAARVRRRDDPDRSHDGRVPRPLRGLLRSGLRLCGGGRRPAPRRCWRCAPWRSRSCWSTGRRSRGWFTRSWRSGPSKIYGQSIASNYQGQGLKLSKHFK